jgi:uncharacterized membrane protein YphA (DoxX/SURF4 family)
MLMLSLFPQILFLSPLGTTLLRIVAGGIFLLYAWTHAANREELGRIRFFIIGNGVWIPLLAALVEFLAGIALVCGIYTQGAAIVGALLALKSLVWRRRYPTFFTLSPIASMLLFAICLSLIVSGAGAFAFDLPL